MYNYCSSARLLGCFVEDKLLSFNDLLLYVHVPDVEQCFQHGACVSAPSADLLSEGLRRNEGTSGKEVSCLA